MAARQEQPSGIFAETMMPDAANCYWLPPLYLYPTCHLHTTQLIANVGLAPAVHT